MKYTMFARHYPVGHPKHGFLTNFVEQIWSAYPPELVKKWKQKFDPDGKYFDYGVYKNLHDIGALGKGTTVRAGFRWQVGDVFQPRIWTERPYASKQLAFMPELTIREIQKFERTAGGDFFLKGERLSFKQVQRVAEHDGLSNFAFLSWFSQPFAGQRIIFGSRALDDTIF